MIYKIILGVAVFAITIGYHASVIIGNSHPYWSGYFSGWIVAGICSVLALIQTNK